MRHERQYRHRSRLIFACIGLTAFIFAQQADARPMVLVQEQCDPIDLEKVKQLIELELASDTAETPLRITLICDGDSLHISAVEGASPDMLERSVDISDSNLRERIIALSVTQLVTRAVSASSGAVSDTAKANTTDPDGKSSHERETALSLTGGIKPRSAFSFFTGYGGARLEFGITARTRIAALVSVEAGGEDRLGGRVDVMCGLAGLGVVQRAASFRVVDFELSVGAALGAARLRGEATPETTAASVRGVAFEVWLGVGPMFRLGRFLIGVELLAGYALPNPVGTVDGEASVSLGGFFAAFGLRIGIRG